ncbi:MAG: leucine-rich repeat protein [Clostridiales bacterium]|nr:leucine-rich repeat protein [Clostridiales bacterium]
MKKMRLIALILALSFLLMPCIAMGESKEEYYQQINTNLNSLESALASQDQATAIDAFNQLRASVTQAARYLAQSGEYDSNVTQILINARDAIDAVFGGDGDYSSYLEQARAYNESVFISVPENAYQDPNGGHRHYWIWSVITPATCTETGIEEGACDFEGWVGVGGHGDGFFESSDYVECHERTTREIPINPNNHNFSVWQLTTPATCSTKGIETKACSRCGALGTETRETDFDLNNHDFSVWQVTTLATCSSKGVETKACSRCGALGTETRETDFDLTNHDFSAWQITTPATCSTKGIETKACSRCGALGTETRETEDFDLTRHAGGTTTEGQNIVCLGCGAVLGTIENEYEILTDDTAVALISDGWLGMDEVTKAQEGTEIFLQLNDNAIPETGHYFTEEFSVSIGNVVWACPVTEFTMPGEAVSISAVQAEQETLTLTFADDPVLLPLDAWMQIQFLDEKPPVILYDEANGTEALDVNRDGISDLLATFPEDETTFDITLSRLPTCAAFGNYAFTFSGPTDHYSTITFSISAPTFGQATFTLPAALSVIEANAFEGDTYISVVDAHNCTSIGAEAFKGCTGLVKIRVEQNCVIHVSAFDDCGTVYVYAPSGGAAQNTCAMIKNCIFISE